MNGAKTLEGKILKGVGGFYYVLEKNGNIYECKARGRFRKDGVTPLPGDNVIFSVDSESYGFIEELLPRKNELKRPRVANIDVVAIVASAGKPKIDAMLCDKLIVSALKAEIVPIMVINKCDTADESEKENLFLEYGNACDTICVSAAAKEGLDELKKRLIGKCTCFAGQSAAGKSSLLNAMFGELSLETGGLSKKTDRGKHTTRHAELLLLEGFSGTAVDTPGFSFLEPEEILPEELAYYYKDIEPYSHDCRFSSCLHAGEPDCSVKAALENGLINKNRYSRYIELLKEIQEKRQRQYD
jgi:ribosome biogenesis GTPase